MTGRAGEAQPTTRDELLSVAAEIGIELEAEELDALARLLAVTGTLEVGSNAAAPPAPGERRLLAPPRPEEDPFNAILRRCSVRTGTEGRLAGLRIGVKDTISVGDIPLSAGSRLLEGFVPERDATVVTRMLDEGAEIVAVLNMDDLAVSPSGETSAFGPVRNPHDRERLAGGSSGGSAAALFYDDIDATLGGDQGGSIRIPSAWCGTVGIKPSFGLVPYTGVLGADATIDHVGPMARSTARVARLLDVLAGADPGDARQREVPPGDLCGALEDGVRGLRIGLLREGFEVPGMQPGVADGVRTACARFEALGAELCELSVPAHANAGGLLAPVLCEGFDSLLESGGVLHHLGGLQDPALADHLARVRAKGALPVSLMAKLVLCVGRILRRRGGGSAYARAQNQRPALRRAYDEALQEVDLLAMPTTPTVAPRLDPDADAFGRLIAHLGVTANTAPFDLSGHPSLSLPCGLSEGLPVGLMLTGRRFEDAQVLRAAAALEAELG